MAGKAIGITNELNRRVDFVRDAGRQLANRLELLGQSQLELECLAVADIPDVEHDACQLGR